MTPFITFFFFAVAAAAANTEPPPAPSCQVVAHPGEKLPAGENILYTPAFRASWTLLKEKVVGEDIRLQQPVSLSFHLNRNPYCPPEIDGWNVFAGLVKDGVLERMKIAADAGILNQQTIPGQYAGMGDAIICYACYRDNMSFATPFEDLAWDFISGTDTSRVSCFGMSKNAKNKAMREQVTVYDYQNPGNFILRIQPSDPGKEIILAKMERDRTLEKMVETVDMRMEFGYGQEISEIDELIIPKLDIRVSETYDELIHNHLANPGFEQYFFAEAGQDIFFRLDESGARAEVTGKVVLIKGPHSIIYAFDRPFLVICRETGSPEPDLVAWIENTDFMTKSP